MSHNERDGLNVFRDAGIQIHKYIYFEMILIKNGSVNADNYTVK